MSTIESAAPTAPRREPGPRLWLSIGVIVAAVVVGAVCGFQTYRAFRSIADAPVIATPARITLVASGGTYDVYERTGNRSSSGGFTFSNDRSTVLDPADVRVTGPGGVDVATRGMGNTTETITKGTAVFTASVRFTASTPGTYTVTVGGTPTQVLVARSFGGVFERIIGWLLGIIAAVLLFIAGVVLLIVGAVRRRNARGRAGGPSPVVPAYAATYAPAYAPAHAPAPVPGWYPDPSTPALWRYHDGQRWTENTAPRLQ